MLFTTALLKMQTNLHMYPVRNKKKQQTRHQRALSGKDIPQSNVRIVIEYSPHQMHCNNIGTSTQPETSSSVKNAARNIPLIVIYKDTRSNIEIKKLKLMSVWPQDANEAS